MEDRETKELLRKIAVELEISNRISMAKINAVDPEVPDFQNSIEELRNTVSIDQRLYEEERQIAEKPSEIYYIGRVKDGQWDVHTGPAVSANELEELNGEEGDCIVAVLPDGTVYPIKQWRLIGAGHTGWHEVKDEENKK